METKITLIINDAPTEGNEEQYALNNYEILTNIINNIPKHNMIIEYGDFNDEIQ